MRKIKFRAWDTVTKDWVPMGVNHISNLVRIKATKKKKGEFLIDTFDSVSRRLVLMQYTGLKDKNGKEVFESDICKYLDDAGDEKLIVTGVITWDKFGWSMKGDYGFDCWTVDLDLDELEVIGNIWENPEL